MFRNLKAAVCLATLWALAGCADEGVLEGEPPTIPLTDGPGSLSEPLDAHDPALWRRADGWVAGDAFNAGWRADNVRFSGGKMLLQLDKNGCPQSCVGRPYASGEYASLGYYGFGRFEVRMKPGRGEGVVSSFILHTGASEGTRWDEIDIEFLGRNTRRFQTNYWTDGVGSHETMIDLPFDAADDFHTYGFEFTRDALHWYVDGKRVHTETGTRGPLPQLPGKIIMNFWPGIGIDIWTGPFTYPGSPMVATYDDIRFSPAASLAVVDDFEAAEAPGAWRLEADPGAQLRAASAPGHIGLKALGLEYTVQASARARVVRPFPAPQDWSQVRYLDFWFHGTASGNDFRVELLDNGPSPEGAERFESRFRDDFNGWKRVSVRMQDFTRRTDGQPSGAPQDGLTLSAVRGLAFEPLAGAGSFRIDQVELERPLEAQQ